jgi:hypothetical protein
MAQLSRNCPAVPKSASFSPQRKMKKEADADRGNNGCIQ